MLAMCTSTFVVSSAEPPFGVNCTFEEVRGMSFMTNDMEEAD
jgi:hypothetical protein